ncbi:hypothetical protein JOC77_002484 [Peribacillus deserti]|uniref:Cytosolic protein n=1 Tax=Peribacillus deserti TaxID=673318 RepID=A0ABS2QJ77_9BACI|nr:hypothetical protein [Peribacillus deserti]MBM7693045.1 hypothetical protein [Peribacillus deserti]
MSTIYEKFDILSLRDIHRQLNEIQLLASAEESKDRELRYILHHVTRAAGMLCSILEQHLEGKIDIDDPLEFIENKVGEALMSAKRMEERM